MSRQSLASLMESLGPEGFYHRVCSLLNEGKLTSDDFSYYELADACGVLPRLRHMNELRQPIHSLSAALQESNPGVGTNLFQVITGELKQQYRLGYDPPPGPRRFRRIEVTTTRKGVVVKTRGGYMPSS